MSDDIPPQAPDFYTFRLPFVGRVRSPLPLNVWFLLLFCGAVILAAPFIIDSLYPLPVK